MLQVLSQQLIFWYLLANAFLNAPVSFNALALTLTMHHLASFWLVYNLMSARLGVEIFVHYVEFSGLHIANLYVVI